MQKVIDPRFIDGYFNDNFNKHLDKGDISGFMAEAHHVDNLTTPNQIIEGVRLDYTPGKGEINPFLDSNLEKVTIIQFTIVDVDNIVIPYGKGMPSSIGGEVAELKPPFTGMG